MKIGINASCFNIPSTGLGQYLIHLTNTMVEIDQQNEYFILGPETQIPDDFHHMQLHAVRPVPIWARCHQRLEQVIWDQWTGPTAARRAKVDLYHVPCLPPPLLPHTPMVVTIHDVIPFRLPLYRTEIKFSIYTRMLAPATKRANLIIAISQYTKQDMIDVLKLPPERIRVIYEAAGDEYSPITNPTELAAVRAHYGLGKRYVFYLGGLDHRKNVLQLVRAFAQLYYRLADPDLQLFIAGDPDRRRGPLYPDPRPLAAELGVSDRIIYHFVEEKDKPILYSGAEVFVFPSLYEGFGLPPLEAMACGAPVICSNRTSLPEVVGNAAITLDPDDTLALVDAMYGVLTNQMLRADLCARSLQRASQFNWRRTASETIAVYEEVFARSQRYTIQPA